MSDHLRINFVNTVKTTFTDSSRTKVQFTLRNTVLIYQKNHIETLVTQAAKLTLRIDF